jgi:hypothetical protein
MGKKKSKSSNYSTLTKKISISKETQVKKKEIFDKSYFGGIKIKEEKEEKEEKDKLNQDQD